MKYGPFVGLVLGGLMMVMSAVGTVPLAKSAQEHAEQVSTDSVKTYLALRILNAGISVAEEVELSGGVGVASGAVQPFKLLEPLDDAVERMSNAVFFIGVIAALLSVLIPTLGVVGFAVTGIGMTIGSGIKLKKWRGRTSGVALQLVERSIRVGAAVYLFVLVFSLGGYLGELVSEKAWSNHSDVISEAADSISVILANSEAPSDIAENAIEVEPSSTPIVEDGDDESNETSSEGLLHSLKNAAGSVTGIVSGSFEVAGDVVGSGVEKAKKVASLISQTGEVVSILLSQADELISAMSLVLASYLLKLIIMPMVVFGIIIRLGKDLM